MSRQEGEARRRIELLLQKGTRAKAVLMVNELRRWMEGDVVQQHMDRGMQDYMAATVAMAFESREMDAEVIAGLLESVDISPSEEVLGILPTLHYRNYNVYINIITFMTGIGVEPGLDNVIEVARAIGISPSAVLAEQMIKYCRESFAGTDKTEEKSGNEPEMFRNISRVIFAISDTMCAFALKEIDRILGDKSVLPFDDVELAPYIGAMGVLDFSGVDQDRGSIGRVIEAVGLKPRDEILNLTGYLHIRNMNHLSYIIALYFLIAVGKEPSSELLIAVVRAMELSPDINVADKIIDEYRTRARPKS